MRQKTSVTALRQARQCFVTLGDETAIYAAPQHNLKFVLVAVFKYRTNEEAINLVAKPNRSTLGYVSQALSK